MNPERNAVRCGNVIATIQNSSNPAQCVDVVYVKEQNAFVTCGIARHFAEREILIPAYLVIADLEMMGHIVSAILEKLSKAQEDETTFQYAPEFEVNDRTFTLRPEGEYVRLEGSGNGG